MFDKYLVNLLTVLYVLIMMLMWRHGEKHKGAGQGADDVVAITLGTGLGGGIISNGELVHGHNGSGSRNRSHQN